MSVKMSGIQREVASLYRQVLRAAKLKDGGSGSTTALVRAEFREQVKLSCIIDVERHRKR